MTFDIDDGSKFPDLRKANLKKSIEKLVKGLIKKDKELFGLAQETKAKLNKQKAIDLKSFVTSQSAAIVRGNKSACGSRELFRGVADDLASQAKPIVLPTTCKVPATGKSKRKTKYPKTNSATPTRGARSRPPSISRVQVNQSVSPAVSNKVFVVQQVETSNYPKKSQRNLTQFARAQAGMRGTSIGDRALVFSANGTPHYGDSYMDKNLAENLAANQAVSNVPLSQIPPDIKVEKPLNASPLQQQPRANVVPKSNTVANMAALGAVAAAVTAVLFFFQQVLTFVQFILQVSQSTATITNIASSFTAILNNLGSLLGLGEDILKPLEETFDSILNNTFGKEKVDYVKFQFAKISGVFVAGQNILSSFGGVKDKLTNLVTRNADNTSRIGNALKMVGMIADTEAWMNENNKANSVASEIKEKLESVSGLASTLTEITETVKTSKEQLSELDKGKSEEDKKEKDAEDKATEKHSDKDIPELRALEEPAT